MHTTERPVPTRGPDGRLAPFHVYARCTENDVDYDYEGGKVLLQAIAHQDVGAVNACNLVVNFSADGDESAGAVMHAFPITRADKHQRFFRIDVSEIDNPIPPEPAVPAVVSADVARLEQENAELRRLLEEQTAPVAEPEPQEQ